MKRANYTLTVMILAVAALFTTVATYAISATDEERIITDEIKLSASMLADNNSQLTLNVPVGQVEIKVADSDVVTILVKIENKDVSWPFSKVDLDSVELSKHIEENQITLELTEDDIKQEWQLILPRQLAIALNIGVGNADIQSLSQSLDANVGVGSVWVSVDNIDYNQMEISVGVGEIQLQGFNHGQILKERVVVSDHVSYQGKGTHNVMVEIGVGDVNIRQQFSEQI
ncbi:hypothetical protein L4D76_19050 [Photobacterium sagamiensis]|uniref:hypothetical protein n=1 Tax=Photobacterium sagamiensis TaxID=2910241 RepID=UPI003D130AE2